MWDRVDLVSWKHHPLTFACLRQALEHGGIRVLSDSVGALTLSAPMVDALELWLQRESQRGVVPRDEIGRWLSGQPSQLAMPLSEGMEYANGQDPRSDLCFLLHGAMSGDL